MRRLTKPRLASAALLLALAACRGGGNASQEPQPFAGARADAPVVVPQRESGEPPRAADVSPSDASPAQLAPTESVSPEPAPVPPAPSATPAEGSTEPQKDPARAAPATPAPERAPGAHAPHNRDAKGEQDVARYIERLESAERERDLKVDVVLARMELPSDAVIGDLGCGPGIFALAFANACPEGIVYASDIEPAQLDRVRTKADERGLRNVIPVLASAHDPHFPLAQLDYVFIADTYHHLEDRVAYMRRLKDVLKPGGKIVLLEYKPGTLPVGPPADHKLPAGVMNQELEQAGYVLIDRFATHAWHDFEIWRRVHAWERR